MRQDASGSVQATTRQLTVAGTYSIAARVGAEALSASMSALDASVTVLPGPADPTNTWYAALTPGMPCSSCWSPTHGWQGSYGTLKSCHHPMTGAGAMLERLVRDRCLRLNVLPRIALSLHA